MSLLSELGTAWATFQAAAIGLSVGTAAATGVAVVVCMAATAHNIYVGVKIVNAIKDKNKKEIAEEGTGESGKETGDSKTGEREYKKKKNIKGKKPKDDIADRFRGQKPFKGESGKEAAKRVLQEYGEYDPDDTGPNSDFNQLKKFFDTHFE